MRRMGTDLVVSQIPSASSEQSVEPRAELQVLYSNSVSQSPNHDTSSGKHEAVTMFESPSRSPRPLSPQERTTSKHLEVTYASSAGGSPRRDGRRPPRQDSAYYSARGVESNGSEADDQQTRQLRARERIVIRRERVQRTRRQAKASRKKVRGLQEDVQDALNKLISKLTELKALNTGLGNEFHPYYETLQRAQDELGPAQADFEDLERTLDDEENLFEEEEDHFYQQNNFFNIPISEAAINAPLSPLGSFSQNIDSEPDDLLLEDDLVRQYLKKIEEAERRTEDVDDLENEYYEAMKAADLRHCHNIPNARETSKFLSDYARLHTEALQDLRNIEDDLFDLRDQCIEQHLFTKLEHIYEPRDAMYDDVMDSVWEARDRSPLRTAAHHLRYNDRDMDFGDKKDYVNKWLFQCVEESTVGTLLLQSIIYSKFPDDAHVLNDTKWSELAVKNWDIDVAGDSANKNNHDSRTDAIAGITPGVVGRIHATSTARSGNSSSLMRSMDVFPDQDDLNEFPPVSDDIGLHETSPLASPTTPKQPKPLVSGSRESPSSLDYSTPPIAAPRPPPVFIHETYTEISDTEQGDDTITRASMIHGVERHSISTLNTDSIATPRSLLSSHTSSSDISVVIRPSIPSSSIGAESLDANNDRPYSILESCPIVSQYPNITEQVVDSMQDNGNMHTSLTEQLTDSTTNNATVDDAQSTPKVLPVMNDPIDTSDIEARVHDAMTTPIVDLNIPNIDLPSGFVSDQGADTISNWPPSPSPNTEYVHVRWPSMDMPPLGIQPSEGAASRMPNLELPPKSETSDIQPPDIQHVELQPVESQLLETQPIHTQPLEAQYPETQLSESQDPEIQPLGSRPFEAQTFVTLSTETISTAIPPLVSPILERPHLDIPLITFPTPHYTEHHRANSDNNIIHLADRTSSDPIHRRSLQIDEQSSRRRSSSLSLLASRTLRHYSSFHSLHLGGDTSPT